MKEHEIAIRQEQLPDMHPTDLLSAIAAAVADPRIDVAKMEKLLEMHERIVADQRKVAYMAAMKKLQAKLPQIDKAGRVMVGEQLRSKYAKYEDIMIVIKPLLDEFGFSIDFDELIKKEGEVTFIATCSHEAGHSERKQLTLPTDKAPIGQKGAIRNAVQDAGSTFSYARRYLLKMHLNLVEAGEDTDGNSLAKITEDQAKDLEAACQEVGMDRGRFLVFMNCGDFTEILQRDLKKALNAIDVKRRAIK